MAPERIVKIYSRCREPCKLATETYHLLTSFQCFDTPLIRTFIKKDEGCKVKTPMLAVKRVARSLPRTHSGNVESL